MPNHGTVSTYLTNAAVVFLLTLLFLLCASCVPASYSRSHSHFLDLRLLFLKFRIYYGCRLFLVTESITNGVYHTERLKPALHRSLGRTCFLASAIHTAQHNQQALLATVFFVNLPQAASLCTSLTKFALLTLHSSKDCHGLESTLK